MTSTVWHCIQCGAPKTQPHSLGRVFLIRHGQTDANKAKRIAGYTNEPLNAEGLVQAQTTATILKDKHVDVILSSDLLRARQTAEIIAKEIGAPIIFEEKFRERNYGALEGMHEPEWKLVAPTLRTDYTFRPEGGENFADLEHRIREAFFAHREQHANKVVALVAHRGTLRMIFKILRGWTHDQAMAYLGAPNGMPFEMEVGEPCEACGNDLYEDPKALAELIAQREREGALFDKTAQSSSSTHE